MSKRIAFGGSLTALCVVLVYLAVYMPSGKLALYAIASLAVAAAVVELGIKGGTTVYAASAILIFMLTGNINALLLFTLFFGCYPLLKFYIEKQRKPSVEILLKLVAFNVLAMLGYLVYSIVFGVDPINFQLFSAWVIAVFVFAAQAICLIYDYVLSRLIDYYLSRIKKSI